MRDGVCECHAHLYNIVVQLATIVIALQNLYKVINNAGNVFLTISWFLPMHDCSIEDTPTRNQLILSFGTAAMHSTKASQCLQT